MKVVPLLLIKNVPAVARLNVVTDNENYGLYAGERDRVYEGEGHLIDISNRRDPSRFIRGGRKRFIQWREYEEIHRQCGSCSNDDGAGRVRHQPYLWV